VDPAHSLRRYLRPPSRKAAIRKEAKEAGTDPRKAMYKAHLEDKALGWFRKTQDMFDIDERIEIANQVIDELGLKYVVPEVMRLSDIPLDQAA
jgi:hypothetical protein